MAAGEDILSIWCASDKRGSNLYWQSSTPQGTSLHQVSDGSKKERDIESEREGKSDENKLEGNAKATV